MNCKNCGKPIHKDRLEALPGVEVCVACSTEQRRVGYMDWAHKTAPALVVVTPGTREAELASMMNKRKR